MSVNAADEEALTKQDRDDKLKIKQQADDFKRLMGEPHGRRFIWRLMAHCRVFQPVFDPHSGVMNFNEGRRGTGLFLLSEINQLCPDLFAVMAAENAPKPEVKPDE